MVVTSTANPAVKAARKLVRRSGRAKAGEAFLVEGPQAVREAGAFLQRLFVTAEAEQAAGDIVAAARDRGAEIVVVSDEILAEVATTVTTQGLVGVAAVPAPDLAALGRAGMLVVLHQVRDPGNAGTAIRTADAAGADAVILTSGSVDAHNPKAVRASVGSIFHLPVLGDVAFSQVVQHCREQGVRLVGADAGGDVVHTEADLAGPVALVFGNEAHGLPANVLAECDDVVRIPLHSEPRDGYTGGAESLNMAATVAVLTYECVRQQGGRLGVVSHHRAPTR